MFSFEPSRYLLGRPLGLQLLSYQCLEGLVLMVSQSGRSPDLLRLAEAARAGGAVVVGFVNDPDPPMAGLCEVVIPLAA